MMKLKRVLALLGVVILVGLFILAIILAVIGAPKNYLMAVIFSMVFIPVVLFSMGLMIRVMKPIEPPEFMREADQGFKQEAAPPEDGAKDGSKDGSN